MCDNLEHDWSKSVFWVIAFNRLDYSLEKAAYSAKVQSHKGQNLRNVIYVQQSNWFKFDCEKGTLAKLSQRFYGCPEILFLLEVGQILFRYSKCQAQVYSSNFVFTRTYTSEKIAEIMDSCGLNATGVEDHIDQVTILTFSFGGTSLK